MLKDICIKLLEEKGLNDEKHKKRLNYELKEIDVLEEEEYFTGLYEEKAKFPQNENNLLVAFLLGLVDEFDIEQEPATSQGDWPDIDIDFMPEVRDYLKRDWAPKHFGQDNICEVGTYVTLGIKSAMLDMARVHEIPIEEIQPITSNMADKDDDGKPMSFEIACDLYPKFAAFCEQYPDVTEAAKSLAGKNKTGGVHAGGLIIANSKIADYIPLEVRSVTKDKPNGIICSAWTEGLAAQDLQPMGYIKYDLLVVDGLKQVAYGAKLVKERHGLDSISALPGQSDWSDIAYLNNKKALATANEGDMIGIFQFNSEGIRRMVKEGGVDSFDDLASYSGLYRPSAMRCLKKGTRVNIEGGYKSIENLKSGYDEVIYVNSQGKNKKTNKFVLHNNGKKRLVKIKTKSGKEMCCSFDHKILTEEEKFQKAKGLKIGQKIAVKL